jgi:hypothetical protein
MLNEKAPEGAGLFFLLDDFVQQPFPAVFATGKAVRNHFHTFVWGTDAVLISVCKPFFHVHLILLLEGVLIGTSIQTANFFSPYLGFLYGGKTEVQRRLAILLDQFKQDQLVSIVWA